MQTFLGRTQVMFLFSKVFRIGLVNECYWNYFNKVTVIDENFDINIVEQKFHHQNFIIIK